MPNSWHGFHFALVIIYMNDMDNQIPEQQHGSSKDIKKQVIMESQEDAEDLFLLAKERLLNVNEWKNIVDGNSAAFLLTDNYGEPLHRNAHLGDYIQIDIPGPGTITGNAKDWVKIEAITYDDYPDENGESLLIQLRPTAKPGDEDTHTAHFFDDTATSTIQVKRWGKIVAAYYYGRNELPNTNTEHLVDTVRNIAVATTAILALSSVQWNNLLDGILNTDKNK